MRRRSKSPYVFFPHAGFNPLYRFRMISQNLLKTPDASMGFAPGYSDNEQVPQLRPLTCKVAQHEQPVVIMVK
jgi:hypothetical protein